MTEKEFQRAYLLGYTSKQNGGKPEANPYIRKPSMRLLRDQWHRGYSDAADKLRGM